MSQTEVPGGISGSATRQVTEPRQHKGNARSVAGVAWLLAFLPLVISPHVVLGSTC